MHEKKLRAAATPKNRQVKCPICGVRLIDEGISTATEARKYDPNSPWRPDYIPKCWHCGAEIGIKKLNI